MSRQKLKLREVDLNITDRCNLKCEFCSVDVLPVSAKSTELSLTRIEQLFEEIEALGVEMVRLVGGEPFVRSDIAAILKLASRFGFCTSVLTNGTAITEEHVHLIKRCGIARITFSVDGHTAELHDRSRGQPRAFDRLLRAVTCCRKNGVRHRMMTALTSAVMPYLKEMVIFAAQHEFELINFIVLGLSGSAIRHRYHFPTYKSWSEAIVDLSLFIRSRRPEVQVSVLFPHEDEVPIELYKPLQEAGCLPLLKTVWNIDYPSFYRKRRHGHSFCAAAHDNVSILPNGDVYGCDLMRGIPEFRAGNILQQSLADIFWKSPVFEALRATPDLSSCAHFDAGSTDFSCGQCRAGAKNLQTFPILT
jgi:AdoMet-dependent heme synthase